MSNRVRALIVICCLVFFSGCAHVISKDLRNKVDSSLTVEKAIQNPSAYKGKTVVWGGEIIETLNQKNGTTEIEVFQIPLDLTTDAPKASNVSEGRFLILVNKYLDPYLYQKGRRITVAGEILGEQIKPLGEMDYRYPLVSSKQIHLWEEYYYPYYYPCRLYDPWWGYPYWWGDSASVITTIPPPIIMAATTGAFMVDIVAVTLVGIMVEETMAVDIGDSLV
jgi:outer membrane lipoprotein